ncbi:MAG: ribonuclease III [Oscillospiraceae bacterium]|nr:ribonuclease III [Oscillospiraceae bacterium]
METHNSIALAFLGDCVYGLLVRKRLLTEGHRYSKLHELSVKKVRASYQAAAVKRIEPLLTEDELAVLKRGRNAKASVPKSATVGEYRLATGLEALFGWLELRGESTRIEELFEIIYNPPEP